MEKIYARFMVWLLAFADSNKNNLKFFYSNFAKITFLSQVVYEGIISASFPAGKEVGR